MIRKYLLCAIAVAVCTAIGSAANHAAAFSGSIWVDQVLAASYPSLTSVRVAALGAPDATFTTGAINYDSSIGGYTVGGFLNNPTLSNPGIAGHDLSNTVILLTGAVTLNAGNNSFLLSHDDGLQLNIDGIGLVVDHAWPTPPTDTSSSVVAPVTGNYTFELSYGECCGAPAELTFTINGVPVTDAVPEPASLVLLGTALAGLAAAITRRRRA